MQRQWLKKSNITGKAYAQYMPEFVCSETAAINTVDSRSLHTLGLGFAPMNGRLHCRDVLLWL